MRSSAVNSIKLNPTDIINQILDYEVLAHQNIKRDISKAGGRKQLLHTDVGQGLQAGLHADKIALRDLITLHLKEFKHPSIQPIITSLNALSDHPEKMTFDTLTALAAITKSANSSNVTMRSNLLTGISTALTQAYRNIFNPLRDDINFSDEESQTDTNSMQALKTIIRRLRINQKKEVSINIKYLLEDDANTVFKALDAGTLLPQLNDNNESGYASLNASDPNLASTNLFALFSSSRPSTNSKQDNTSESDSEDSDTAASSIKCTWV